MSAHKIFLRSNSKHQTKSELLSLSLSRNRLDFPRFIKLLMLCIIAGSFTLSQAKSSKNTDEEIQRLEKELRLLELQKQVEQAKQNSKKQDDTTTNAENKQQDKELDNTKQASQSSENLSEAKRSLCGGKHSLSACFVGFEVGANVGSSANFTETQSFNPTKYSGIIESQLGGSYVAFVGSIIGGYQWYFTPKMGLGIRANLGYGGSVAHSTFALTSITWGAGAQYLVNFTRIFGISLGVGFEMNHFLYADTLISSSVAIPAFATGVGIHFTTKNNKHQFGIQYKYRLKNSKNIQTQYTSVTINQGGIATFSYMYRF